MLDADSNRPMAILRDSGAGRVLGMHRDPAFAAPGRPGGMAAALAAEPGPQVLFSRGIPDSAAWNP